MDKIRVIIIDDSSVNAKLLEHIIRKDQRFELTGIASSGREGIELHQKEHADIILIDINLPDMSGYEVTQKILENGFTPILLISAGWEDVDEQACYKAIDAGALSATQKPVGSSYDEYNEVSSRLCNTIVNLSKVESPNSIYQGKTSPYSAISQHNAQSKLSVLIIDDSPTDIKLLTEIFNETPDINVCGVAQSAEEAMKKSLDLFPDIVLLDIHLPDSTGYDLCKKMLEHKFFHILLISGSWNKEDMRESQKAIEAGALSAIRKPTGPKNPKHKEEKEQLVDLIRVLSKCESPTTLFSKPITDEKIILIGSSLGGPLAIKTILSSLPSDFTTPIIIAQHIEDGFVKNLTSWLSQFCPLQIKTAEDGDRVRAKTVYIAPSGYHIELLPNDSIHLIEATPNDMSTPSIDRLFESAARYHGPKTIAALLTGIGNDGAKGMRQIEKAGGIVLIQNPLSCVVFGMAKEALVLTEHPYVLSLEKIATLMAKTSTGGEGRAA